MKNIFRYVLVLPLLAALLLPTGCSKSGEGATVPLPDISDFTIIGATPFTAGSSATVNIYCTSLGSGTYQVHYDLSGYNTKAAQSSKLVMNNSYGSFTTSALPNAGETFMTINSITNSNGGGTVFTTNNKYTLTDSTGSMWATIGGSNLFHATDVLATMNGTKLSITGVTANPATTMTINVDNYSHMNGEIDFSSYNVPEVANIQYQATGGGGLVSANGIITFVSVGPQVSGTFSFTAMDSTHVTGGSFTADAP